VPYENMEQRIKQLESYLENLLQIGLYLNHHETVRVTPQSPNKTLCVLWLRT